MANLCHPHVRRLAIPDRRSAFFLTYTDASVLQELRSRLKSGAVMRGAATTFLIQVVGAGLAYGMQVALARWLGVTDYGEYTYAMAWVTLLAVPAGLGLASSIVRFIPEYAVGEQGPLLRGVVVRGYQLVLLSGVAVASLGLGAVTWFGPQLRYTSVLVLAMALVPLRALMQLQTGIGRGLKAMVAAYGPQKILRPCLLVGSVGLLVLWERDVTPEVALWCTIGAGTAVVLVQSGFLWYHMPGYVLEAQSRYRTRHWMRIALPLLLISGFVLLLGRTDVIMLGLLSDARSVGVYNVASRTATLVTFVLTSVNAIAGPTISTLYTEGSHEALQRLASTVAQYIFWPSVAIALGLVALSGFILGLFGSDFADAQPVLWILVVGYIVNAGAGSVGYFMNMTGHQDQSAQVFGCTALLNIVLNAVGIPLYGAVGAAAATATSMAIWNVWLNVLVVRNLGVHASILGIFHRPD